MRLVGDLEIKFHGRRFGNVFGLVRKEESNSLIDSLDTHHY